MSEIPKSNNNSSSEVDSTEGHIADLLANRHREQESAAALRSFFSPEAGDMHALTRSKFAAAVESRAEFVGQVTDAIGDVATRSEIEIPSQEQGYRMDLDIVAEPAASQGHQMNLDVIAGPGETPDTATEGYQMSLDVVAGPDMGDVPPAEHPLGSE